MTYAEAIIYMDAMLSPDEREAAERRGDRDMTETVQVHVVMALPTQDAVENYYRLFAMRVTAALGLPEDSTIEQAEGAIRAMQEWRVAYEGAVTALDNATSWVCTRCHAIVDPREVTYSEHHEGCGGKCL